MNSISESLNCNILTEKLSYLLIFISFSLGVIFFSRSKYPGSPLKNLDNKERELIEMEQSFFLDNSEEIIRRNSLY
jgi:hypothetical protein